MSDSEVDHAVLIGGLHLLHARSVVKVGTELMNRYKTDDEMQAFLSSPEFIENFEAFTVVCNDVATQFAESGDYDQAVAQHYDRAMDALQGLADVVGVTPADLASILL